MLCRVRLSTRWNGKVQKQTYYYRIKEMGMKQYGGEHHEKVSFKSICPSSYSYRILLDSAPVSPASPFIVYLHKYQKKWYVHKILEKP